MAKVKTSINLDPKLKDDATKLFESFGLDLSTAIAIYLAQAVREQKIPFEIKSIENTMTPLESGYDITKDIENENKQIDDSIEKTNFLMEDLSLELDDVK